MKLVFNNLFNTLGIGNPMPPKRNCLTGADFADDKNRGSGDLWPVIGQSPSDLWSDDYKKQVEDGLKQQEKDKNKVYKIGEERPLLVFKKEK